MHTLPFNIVVLQKVVFTCVQPGFVSGYSVGVSMSLKPVQTNHLKCITEGLVAKKTLVAIWRQ